MGPALEMEAKLNALMEISATKQNNGSVLQNTLNETNFGDNSFNVGALSDGKSMVKNECKEMGVDMIECIKSQDDVLAEAECQDITENSSSFSGTMSGTENASTMNDVEVESPFCGDIALASMFDGHNGVLPMRKKKLTDHWQRFIRPIMWRCKWIELQIKEIQSQALKYDRELAKYDQKRQFESEKSMSEGFDANSQPFTCQILGNQVMKRKKRKRVEEITDLASYMSQHNLFSYYEDKRSNADGAGMENDYVNLGNKTINGTEGLEINDGWPFLEFRDGDSSVEEMLSNIDVVQSHVRKLKNRIDKVMSENPGKYTSINRLTMLVPCEALTGFDRKAASPPQNGNGVPDRTLYISPQSTSECNTGDLFKPGSVVSSHGDVTPLPDMSGSTGQPQVGDSCKTNKQAVVVDSHSSDEELHNFERVISQFTARPVVSSETPNASPPAMTPEADSPAKTSMPSGQPSTSKSIVRNNKRKWGRQKSRMGRWKRRSKS